MEIRNLTLDNMFIWYSFGLPDCHTALWVREPFGDCRSPKARISAPEGPADRKRDLCGQGLAKVRDCDDIQVVSCVPRALVYFTNRLRRRGEMSFKVA